MHYANNKDMNPCILIMFLSFTAYILSAISVPKIFSSTDRWAYNNACMFIYVGGTDVLNFYLVLEIMVLVSTCGQ